MNIAAYRDEIKLLLTGNLLELEIDDTTLDRIINSALRELQRYICSTSLITIPFSKCIDLSNLAVDDKPIKINSVVRVYRPEGYVSDNTGSPVVDPMLASQWQMLSGVGNLANFLNYIYNYESWNTLLLIRNTTSTDLSFKYDKSQEKLYINVSLDYPLNITIEYIPRYENVDEINSDYWIDMLTRLSVALTKVMIGRIRTRYTQSGALWSQDGDQILSEGTSELNELRSYLQANTLLVYPVD